MSGSYTSTKQKKTRGLKERANNKQGRAGFKLWGVILNADVPGSAPARS